MRAVKQCDPPASDKSWSEPPRRSTVASPEGAAFRGWRPSATQLLSHAAFFTTLPFRNAVADSADMSRSPGTGPSSAQPETQGALPEDASSEDAPREKQLREAVAAVRERTTARPTCALILGSGLGVLAKEADDATTVAGADIPHYPASTVSGHEGRLVFGTLEGADVVFVQGRVHYYEGYPLARVVFPVQLVEALGAERLVVTNSAGGINRAFPPGTLMFITDHLNAAFASPLTGRSAPTGRMSVDAVREATQPPYYDPDWTDAAQAVANELELDTERGTYLWTKGPSYETEAEIEAFSRLGADAVGMSTVPEVIQARRQGLRVLGLSTITNPAAGIGDAPLDHDDVLAVGRQVRHDLARLVRGIVRVTVA
jgi:purine-nucleoside phosphorylase